MGPLISIKISGFQGIASFYAEPNGQSIELRGENGSGKSSTINALWWSLGGKIDEEVIRNGEEEAKAEIVIGDYRVTRKQKRGSKPTLNIKAAETGTPLGSSPSLLKGFLEQIERNTFSRRKPSEQAGILRSICPGCDTSALDAEYAARFAERTDVNRDAKTLAAQAEGVKVPDAPSSVPDDIDIVAIAEQKAEAEKLKAENQRKIKAEFDARSKVVASDASVQSAIEAVQKAEKFLQQVREINIRDIEALRIASEQTKELPVIDTAAIDAEITAARKKNTEYAQYRQQIERAKIAREQREALAKQAMSKHKQSERITERLAAIEAEKAEQLAAAKLPIDGLAIAGDVVTLNGVEIGALDNFPRMMLDVQLAAKQGHRLCAVRDAILLTSAHRADLERAASSLGVQCVIEVVAEGMPLTAEIIEAE